MTYGTITTIFSSSLEREVEIRISLPEGLGCIEAPCPVVYVLDGETKTMPAAASVQLLAKLNLIPLSIVVGIETHHRHRDFNPDDLADRLLDFIELELAPMIERSHQTAPHRTLVGHSLGGLFVMHALASRPQLFDAYLAISSSLRSGPVAEGNHTPAVLLRLEKRLHELSEPPGFLYLAAGEHDRQDILEELARSEHVLQKTAPAGLTWHSELLDAEDHGSCIQPGIWRGLKILYTGWSDRMLLTSGSLSELRAHYAEQHERYGYPIVLTEERLIRAGFAFLGRSRLDEAREVFSEAIKAFPDSPRGHDGLAYALEATGAIGHALDSCRTALTLARRPEYEEQFEGIQRHLGHLENAADGAGRTADS